MRDGRRVMLVGIDGADWRVLSPRIDGGAMPALRGLVERGASGRLAPFDPSGGTVGWTTILTGVPAWRHGVLSEEVPLADGSGVRAFAPSDRLHPTLWEMAASQGLRTSTSGWDAAIVPGDVPAWAESIAAHAPAGEHILASLLRAAARAFDAELRAAESACAVGPWDLACVRTAWFGVLVREFVRFAPPPGPGVDPVRAELFGGVVDGACRALDAWIGRMAHAAGDGASVVVVGERGIDLEQWRSAVALRDGGPVTRMAAPASVVVVAGPGVRPDSVRFGTVATDVASIVREALGLDAPEAPAGRDAALPVEPRSAGSAAVEALVHARDAAFASSAAMGGAPAAAVAAARRMAARRPTDVATALLLSDLLAGTGAAPEAVEALERCRRARAEACEPEPGGGWTLALGMSRALAAVGRGEEALSAVDAAIGAPAVEVAEARAIAAEASGDAVACERAARAAIAADATRRTGHVMLARALFRQERWADAATAAREALGMAWADPSMHFLLGTALAADRRPGEAIAALEQCLRLEPAHAPALRRLAAIHARQLGDIDAARGFMARAMAAGRAGRDPGPR